MKVFIWVVLFLVALGWVFFYEKPAVVGEGGDVASSTVEEVEKESKRKGILDLFKRNDEPADQEEGTEEEVAQIPVPAPAPTPAPVVKTPPSEPAPVQISRIVLSGGGDYGTALGTYKGKVFQISLNNGLCQITPNTTQTYKTGVKVMFDNRHNGPVYFDVDGVPYTLYGYKFGFITLASNSLPHTVKVDCGRSKNVATITLQK